MKEKTNAIRKIESKKVEYRLLDYSDTPYVSASEVAAYLDVSPDALFKTLVVQGKKDHYVFLIPASSELDLKKAALATGEKKIALLPSRELYPLTGYVHGGCSPIGMKKRFRRSSIRPRETFPASVFRREDRLQRGDSDGGSDETDRFCIRRRQTRERNGNKR